MPKRINETLPKCCTKCGETKAVSEFSRGSIRKDGTYGLSSACKKCRVKQTCKYHEKPEVAERRRERNKAHYVRTKEQKKKDTVVRVQRKLWKSRGEARKYGHLPCNATVEELLAAFTGRCHICQVPEMECERRLCMDHDHETGEFRGWLCARCNQAAGLLSESAENALSLAAYIKRAKVSIDGK